MLFVYPAVFVEESDGRYSVLFPDFDCATCGDSLSHANRMAEECLLLQLRTMQDERREFPTPSDETPELLKKTCLDVEADPDSAFWGSIVVNFENMDIFQKIAIITEFHKYVRNMESSGVTESLISEICGCRNNIVLRALYELSINVNHLCLVEFVNVLYSGGESDDEIASAADLLPSTILSFRTWDADGRQKVRIAFGKYKEIIQKTDSRHYSMTLSDVLNTAVHYAENVKTYVEETEGRR